VKCISFDEFVFPNVTHYDGGGMKLAALGENQLVLRDPSIFVCAASGGEIAGRRLTVSTPSLNAIANY